MPEIIIEKQLIIPDVQGHVCITHIRSLLELLLL